MPPEHKKNGNAKKLKRAGREARDATERKATAHNLTAHKAAAQKVTAQQAIKSHTRSAARSASSTRSASPAPSASSTQSASSKRPTVALVGAGRLGSALALALGQSGYTIVALVARRAHHARRAARTLSPQPLALGATQLDSLPETDLLLITTPDDQIAAVASRLARVFAERDADAAPSLRRRRPAARIALHASGALVSGALAPLGAHGFSLGSLHPLVSITDPLGGAEKLRGAFYCLEGESRARAAANRVVRALGGQSFSIDARHKPLYHAAAVITSGHTVALFSLAAALLARCGLTPARARRVLLPLLASTLDNLRAHAPAEALTGTFARADLSTVRKHLAALGDLEDDPLALAVYALLGERSLQLAAQRGAADASALAEISRALTTAAGGARRE